MIRVTLHSRLYKFVSLSTDKEAHWLVIVFPVKEVGSSNDNLVSAICIDVSNDRGAQNVTVDGNELPIPFVRRSEISLIVPSMIMHVSQPWLNLIISVVTGIPENAKGMFEQFTQFIHICIERGLADAWSNYSKFVTCSINESVSCLPASYQSITSNSSDEKAQHAMRRWHCC